MLLDVQLPGISGHEALEAIRKLPDLDSQPTVIMISGHGTLSDAVRATKAGAYDFMEKPLDRERLMVTLRNASERRAMAAEVAGLRALAEGRWEMVGRSPAMEALFAQIAKVAPTRTRVLITGESGTGKELIARAIHRESPLRDKPFVKVNCAAIPPELIESELFGHERGAFTGATARKKGLFELADGGTIFLDEVGDMIVSAQAKVLRVLQSGEFNRVGGEQTLKADVRVVAATNRDLQAAVATGQFREDLYFRLNVVPLRAPALRERAEDMPLLAQSFVEQICRENGMKAKTIAPEALALLAAYPWPGNVRELRNVIERLVILSDEGIGVGDLPEEIVAEANRQARPRRPPPRARSSCRPRRVRCRCANSAISWSDSTSGPSWTRTAGTSRAPPWPWASSAPTCTRRCGRWACRGTGPETGTLGQTTTGRDRDRSGNRLKLGRSHRSGGVLHSVVPIVV